MDRPPVEYRVCIPVNTLSLSLDTIKKMRAAISREIKVVPSALGIAASHMPELFVTLLGHVSPSGGEMHNVLLG
jgi:hypothetical protein